MAPPCPDRQSEFINSKCLPGNPGQDLSTLVIKPSCSNSRICTVTALNRTVLQFHKEVLLPDPLQPQGHFVNFLEGVLVSPGTNGYSGCLRMARRVPEPEDLDSQWHTHSQTPPRCTPARKPSVSSALTAESLLRKSLGHPARKAVRDCFAQHQTHSRPYLIRETSSTALQRLFLQNIPQAGRGP